MEKGDVKHYIITRFSVQMGPGFQKNSQNLFESDRLETRFLIFETFCLPSVIGQTSKNFNWLILIDRDLPTLYLGRLQNLLNDYENIHLVTYDHAMDLKKLDFIEDIVGKIRSKYVITSRLDDDDALRSTFVEKIQQDFATLKNNDILYLSYPSGYHWKPDPTKEQGLFSRTYYECIALGLSMMTVKEKYPLTCFRHHRKIVATLEEDKHNSTSTLSQYAAACGDDISNWDMESKLKIVETKDRMYLRTIHGENDAAKLTSTRWFKEPVEDFESKNFSLDPEKIKEANEILSRE